MFFTVAVDMADGGTFEYSTESIVKFLQTIVSLGHPDLQAAEDDEDFEYDEVEIPDEIADHFVEGEEYEYDEDAGCWCWYDEEHEAWYWLNIETGEWLLVEDAEGYEVESEDDESDAEDGLEAA